MNCNVHVQDKVYTVHCKLLSLHTCIEYIHMYFAVFAFCYRVVLGLLKIKTRKASDLKQPFYIYLSLLGINIAFHILLKKKIMCKSLLIFIDIFHFVVFPMP